jgi:uncharacterized membrane protein YidH (DUF202 family)
MIRGYSDHAANEWTFLAWLRTSIAVIAFGFVVEKFNLFALTLLDAIRFVRTGWLLDDTAVHTPSILIFSVILVAMLIALSAYLVVW